MDKKGRMIMKSNNYKIDFLNKEIRVTKSFYQSAQIFGTEECNIMIAIKEKSHI